LAASAKGQENAEEYPAAGKDANIDAWTARIVVLVHSQANGVEFD